MTGIERLYNYCSDVESGKILTNQYIKQAVQRFRNNIKSQEDPNYPYYFDEEAGNKIIQFAEATKQYNDEWRGKPLVLQPWQCFILGNIYGWKKKATKYRRFNKAFVFCGRKQGKSTLMSICLLYDLLTTPGSQALALATKREQSKIVWNCCKEAIKQNEGLSKRLKIYNSSSRIVNERLAGYCEAMSSESDKMDGLNCSCAVIDEVAAMKNFDIIKVIQSGQGSRPEPLLIEITSGSDDQYSAGALEFERSTKILDGSIDDDSFFCVLYCLDKGDDWKDKHNDPKANPNLNISIKQEFIDQMRREAIQQPSLEGEFRTKLMGQFISPVTSWIPYNVWKNSILNAKSHKLPEDLSNCAVIGAVDLSQRSDFTAYTLYIYEPDTKLYFAKHHFYFPENQIEKKLQRDSPMIRKWIENGYITTTPGDIVNYSFMFDDIKSDIEKYNTREILFDPWNATTLINDIGPLVNLVEITQNLKNISPMAKDFEASIMEKKIVDDNPVLAWMISNCDIYSDANGNIKPVKHGGKDSGNRIDGVVTSVMAMGRLKQLLDSGEIDYRTADEIRADMEAKFAALPDY